MKLTIGVKRDERVVYLDSKELDEIYDVDRFVVALKIWLRIYFKIPHIKAIGE